jgi:hypothetical protein
MKRPQITPGPWHLGKRAGAEHGAIYGDKGEEIALPLGFFMEDHEAKANSKAIAAVPALLEALGDFVRLAQNSPFGSTIEVHESYFEEARAALRLAGYEF